MLAEEKQAPGLTDEKTKFSSIHIKALGCWIGQIQKQFTISNSLKKPSCLLLAFFLKIFDFDFKKYTYLLLS